MTDPIEHLLAIEKLMVELKQLMCYMQPTNDQTERKIYIVQEIKFYAFILSSLFWDEEEKYENSPTPPRTP